MPGLNPNVAQNRTIGPCLVRLACATAPALPLQVPERNQSADGVLRYWISAQAVAGDKDWQRGCREEAQVRPHGFDEH